MPWVRIDENAMEHPKIGGLPDGAFRLWVQALAYCQKFLTDGYVNLVALRGLRAYSPKRHRLLVAAVLWIDAIEGGIRVHDYLDWNDSRDEVLAAREGARDRRRRSRDRHASQDAGQTANVPSGVVCSEIPDSPRGEGGTGETATTRAGAFCQWYEDTHQRLFGVGYMGTNGDYGKALELVAVFSDQELRDAALVWFGMDDDFATCGTRTIPKFASRATGCLQEVKRRGIA